MKEKSRKYGSFMKQLSLLYYEGTKTGDAIIGFAVSYMPQCGYRGLSTRILFIVGSICSNTGLEVSVDDFVNSCPSQNKIQSFVTDHTVIKMVLI